MGRRKGSLWGSKKGSKPSSTRAEKAARRPEPAEVPIDWGQFYDKLSTRGNSRGKCVDDLVLLEDVSNEGIVEVSTDGWLNESFLPVYVSLCCTPPYQVLA